MFIIINIIRLVDEMKKAVYNILPKTEEILKTMGEQIKLARLRRSLSAELVAERAGISRASLWKVEKGDPSVAMGIYAAVLHALNNLDQDLLLIAKDDELGRQLQELSIHSHCLRCAGDILKLDGGGVGVDGQGELGAQPGALRRHAC